MEGSGQQVGGREGEGYIPQELLGQLWKLEVRISKMQRDSDLAVIPLILILILAVLVVFAAYFFVGAVLGTILLIGLLVVGIWAGARFIAKNDLT
jgi:hypothetical protein